MYATQSQTGKQLPSSTLRLMWLLLIALTLGLCLLAPKRPATQLVYENTPQSNAAQLVQTHTAAAADNNKMMVLNVTRIDPIPIWSTGMQVSDVMHDERYDRN